MGAPGQWYQASHIPPSDHGCKLTGSEQQQIFSLAHTAQFFRRKQLAGWLQLDPDWNVLLPSIAVHFPHCLTAQLTGVIGLTLWEAVFRCVSQWSERGRRAVTGRKYEQKRQRHPTFSRSSHAKTQAERKCSYIKTSCPFPLPHLFLMLGAGYNL